ncbi:MAG: EAL domain-containing protein [Alphaproteobacteria bacterium]
MEKTPGYIVKRCINDKHGLLLLQPIFSVKTDMPFAHEIYLRLLASDGRPIAPAAFLPTATVLGMLHDIDLLTLDLIRRDLLPKLTPNVGKLAVNVALKSLMQHDYLSRLATDAWQVQLRRLVFEMHDHELLALPESEKVIKYLTGKSISLTVTSADVAVLKRAQGLGVQNLKLDIGKFGLSPEGLKNIVQTAKKIGFMVTLSNIETRTQHQVAMAAEADYVQGYHYVKPQTSPVQVGLRALAGRYS